MTLKHRFLLLICVYIGIALTLPPINTHAHVSSESGHDSNSGVPGTAIVPFRGTNYRYIPGSAQQEGIGYDRTSAFIPSRGDVQPTVTGVQVEEELDRLGSVYLHIDLDHLGPHDYQVRYASPLHPGFEGKTYPYEGTRSDGRNYLDKRVASFGHDDLIISVYAPGSATARWTFNSDNNLLTSSDYPVANLKVEILDYPNLDIPDDRHGDGDWVIHIQDTSRASDPNARVTNTIGWSAFFPNDRIELGFKDREACYTGNESDFNRSGSTRYELTTIGPGDDSGNPLVYNLLLPDRGNPEVLHIRKTAPTEDIIRGPFTLEVLLTETAANFTPEFIHVANGTITSVIAGAAITTGYYDVNGNGVQDTGEAVADISTAREDIIHPYTVNITPYLITADDVVVTLLAFSDLTRYQFIQDGSGVASYPVVRAPGSSPGGGGPYTPTVPNPTDGVDYLPDDKQHFGITLLTPDVSARPGHQVTWDGVRSTGDRYRGRPEAAVFTLAFQFDTEVRYDLPGSALPTPVDDTASGTAFGHDDIIINTYERVYDPNGSLLDDVPTWDPAWTHAPIAHTSGAVPLFDITAEIRDAGGSTLTAGTVRTDYTLRISDSGFDRGGYHLYIPTHNTSNSSIHTAATIPSELTYLTGWISAGSNVRASFLDANRVLHKENFNHLFPDDRFIIQFRKGAIQNANTADIARVLPLDSTYALATNDYASFEIEFVDHDRGTPRVRGLNRMPPTILGTGPHLYSLLADINRTDWELEPVGSPFLIEVVLSEEPVGGFTLDHLEVTNGTATRFEVADLVESPYYAFNSEVGTTRYPVYNANGDFSWDSVNEAVTTLSTGRDLQLYRYVVTIEPTLTSTDDVVIAVKDFADNVLPTPNWYTQRDSDKLYVPVNPDATGAPPAAYNKATDDHIAANGSLTRIPEGLVIPANGYLVLAKGTANDGANPSGIEHSPPKPADKKTPPQQLYNITYGFSLEHPGDDLANFFRNGSTLQLLHVNLPGNTTGANGDIGYGGATNQTYNPGDVIISEIMWGLDRYLTDSQYIELHNTTNADIGIDKNEWVLSVKAGTDPLYTTTVDVIGNQAPNYWVPIGSSGSTLGGMDEGETPGVIYEVDSLISMSRVRSDGTTADGWAASVRPSANLHGARIGTPGAPNNPPMVEPIGPPPGPSVATTADILISEIMFSTLSRQLPQWIELANVSDSTINLDGWSLSIVNNAADGVGASYLSLSGLEIPAGQVALIVSGSGRQGLNRVNADRVMNADKTLLSEMGFMLSLVSPTGTGDVAGNLSTRWTLPTAETGRSSLVRTSPDIGTAPENWSLSRVLAAAYVQTYYGAASDAGTPGWHGQGGALPVELSLFVATRDPLTGSVEIRWETESESNNAGFHIKRSETQTGPFSVITPALIPGAGTTAEKQTYSYTDATAKPNVVYYYQIEDVSLAGDRQTLIQPHRLKGHLTATGKATLLWGTLKNQE